MNLALSMLAAGPSGPQSGKLLDDASLQPMEGYQAEIVANGLNFLSVIAVAGDGTVYVSELGFAYRNVSATPSSGSQSKASPVTRNNSSIRSALVTPPSCPKRARPQRPHGH